MATKVAINGFGRIGRLVARAILERDDHELELVSINDLADTKSNALLFQYDSTHGRFPGTVEVGDNAIIVNGKSIAVTSERDPGDLPQWLQGLLSAGGKRLRPRMCHWGFVAVGGRPGTPAHDDLVRVAAALEMRVTALRDEAA